ncbi:D-2-hydroxyacid dehydrogenase [Companilactobacillus bobalius]|uniref:D-lactate dehydrogenase n=2 Tax=Companilactobacillus bobalius TaxID=2801451 RepID=A0A202FDS1_9LACO|nr:D-2-hydroxyacid dehydrogenase [Companilactobacillus bobalius]KAE9556957.1 D-2-hydroxyisocaproate dehydrogenase [Companilactobacillus bobalius]KRK81878.1 d-lactate dehydrogenase [Companilactobacillus bobalius DSM 19674]OVE98611.1 D-lactate dehydrogenase [Companilactobacillus bobalius]GEO59034.1 lactate dehydrogenase [Companilactobacillus paralimentarius]
MKIFCYAVSKLEEPYVLNWAKKNNVEVKMIEAELSSKNAHLAEGYDGVSSEGITPVDESVYAEFEKFGIKQLAIRQVGVDNQDLDAARRHGITLTNVAAYSPRAIAEMGVTQAMYLLRKIGVYQDRMSQGDFTWDESTISTEIFNCTIGLVGVGHIGGATAQIYSALGAKVLAYDLAYDASLEPYVTYTDLDTVLSQSDIISLHTPLFPSTRNMIGAKEFKKMKSNAILINVARGELVDTKALIDALQNHEIGAAGLDTLADEIDFFGMNKQPKELPEDYQVLNAMPNVLVTPHIAFFTKLAIRNSMEIALDDAKKIIEGGKSRNTVN